jgi:hypothetical protein
MKIEYHFFILDDQGKKFESSDMFLYDLSFDITFYET